jgi:hypothetical protein
MPLRHRKIEECVETLCHQGCNRVYDHIRALQHNVEFPEVADLSAAERLSVLEQLVTIMDIYDGSCGS